MKRFGLRTGLLVSIGVGLTACQDSITPPAPLVDAEANPLEVSAPLVAHGQGAIPDHYIVVFRENVRDVPGLANGLVQAHGGSRGHVYQHALKGFSAYLPPQAVTALQNNPNIAYIEADGIVTGSTFTTQTGAEWGLDRIDQRDLPLDDEYGYRSTGAGVTVYVIDSGIRLTHGEFGGRASFGADFINDGNDGFCHPHGTHVAGTIGGETFGVAKEVDLVNVRVLNCANTGTWGGVIAGVDWVTANATVPAVTNMSLGGGFTQSVNDAVAGSVAAGVVYSISAGNDGIDACDVSPASTSTAITVGATMETDSRSIHATWSSNIGTCLDIFAPGSNVVSAVVASDAATGSMSGTSMAAPHVAGVAALYLERFPAATPAAVANAILSTATAGRLTNIGTGSPNLLLHSLAPGNSAPTADPGGPYAGDEGSPVAFDGGASSDPDDDPLDYAWNFGDGNTGAGVAPSHTYLDDGAYTVTLTVTDPAGESHTATSTATIANVAPIVDAGPDASITSNEPFQFSGTFSDPGILDAPWSWIIDWGDESTTAGSTNNQALPILASHQFCAAGPYTVTLTVVDEDEGSGSDQMILTVDYLGVQIVIKPSDDPSSVGLSGQGMLPVAVLSSTDFDATQIEPATVTLGDEVGSDTPVAQRPNGRYFAEIEDVNGDGLPDVVFRFRVPELVANGDLTAASTSLVLRGFLGNECTNFRGEDSVRVVP